MSHVHDGSIFGPAHPCFGCGPAHPIGLKLAFERDGDEVVTRYTPTDLFQGPPGIMHGGLVATLADEIAAWTVIVLKERLGFTSHLEARLKRPVRIGVPVEGRGKILGEEDGVVRIAVKLLQDGAQAFKGEFEFTLMDKAAAERFLGTTMPETWAGYAR
jgi:acyl-coenzyme A thioesterase PaaI-like protein